MVQQRMDRSSHTCINVEAVALFSCVVLSITLCWLSILSVGGRAVKMYIHGEIKENIIFLKISQQIQNQFNLLGLLQMGYVICRSLKQKPICLSIWLFYLQLHFQTWVYLVNGVCFSALALSCIEMIFLGALVHFNHLLHADPCIPACSAAVGTPAFFREEPFCRRVGYLVTSESKNCLQDFTQFLVSLNDPMLLFANLTVNTRFCFRAQQGVPCWLCFFV